MQKALTKMTIQLANVISDIAGVSGQKIIAAILQGERDPYKLADLKNEKVPVAGKRWRAAWKETGARTWFSNCGRRSTITILRTGR